MLGQCLLVLCVGFFLGLMFGLFLLVVLQFFLILFLSQLVIRIRIGIIIIDLLVVVADCLIVVVNLLIVVANCFIIILSIHAIGVGHIGSIGHIQIGIGQKALGVLLVLACNRVVILLGLIVIFDGVLIFIDGFIIFPLDFTVETAGLEYHLRRVVFYFDFVHGAAAVQDIGIIQFYCLRLSGQCNSHCHSDSNGAASLGQELLIILLSHNFNLLFLVERLKYWQPGCHSGLL